MIVTGNKCYKGWLNELGSWIT